MSNTMSVFFFTTRFSSDSPLVQFVAVLVNDVAEADGNVAQSDDDIAADVRVLGGLQDFEQETVIEIAELRAHAKELAECQCCGVTKYFILVSVNF